MDPTRFDALVRSLAAPKSRRGILGGLAALGAGLASARVGGAQVSQAQCGNVTCRTNPGKCNTGCVCCDYGNGNSRCRPPGACAPGVVLCPPGQVLGPSGVCSAPTTTTSAPTTTTTTTLPPCGATGTDCAADGDCCIGVCQAGTCVATIAGTCAPGADLCADFTSPSGYCGNGSCACFQTVAGATVCADTRDAFCVACEDCLPDQVCVRVSGECCGGSYTTICANPCPPEGGEAMSCFTGETLVAMADGTTRPIARVAVGDLVLGQTGTNRVESIERPRLGARRLYALNAGPAFVTAEHPFLTEEGWKAIDPAATAAENPLLAVGRLAVGDQLLALVGVAAPALVGGGAWDGAVEPRFEAVNLGSLIGMPGDPATPLYNLRLDGDHSYVANDLVVHNK